MEEKKTINIKLITVVKFLNIVIITLTIISILICIIKDIGMNFINWILIFVSFGNCFIEEVIGKQEKSNKEDNNKIK